MEQLYTPDWASIPEGYVWVAVDPDGKVCAYTQTPFVRIGILVQDQWYFQEGEMMFVEFVRPVGDRSWKEMLYERPKNETHSPAAPVGAA